ncbi:MULTISPECIES: ComF family protein [Marinobacter]|nr:MULTISPECIES: ComF family protein [Marinobacter]
MNRMIKGLLALSTCFHFKVNSLRTTNRALCVACLAGNASSGLCPPCRGDLPVNLCHCRSCALPLAFRPFTDTGAGPLCGECQQSPPPFTRVLAPWRYRYPVDRMIQRYKYHGQRAFAAPLIDGFNHYIADQLSQRLAAAPDVLVPAPMHPARRRKRGFNQAEDLAEQLARHTGIRMDSTLVQRIRKTSAQSALSREQRLANLSGIFRVTAMPPARVAIVDDVVTTGATARVLTTALLDAGAREVEVWALARTPG